MNRAPHREPMIAALARREHLHARIAELDLRAVPGTPAPTSLAAALAENARLEHLISNLERRATERRLDDAELELAPVVHDDADAAPRTFPVGSERSTQAVLRRVVLTLGAIGPIAALVVAERFSMDRPSTHAAKPPHEATTVSLTGVVLSRTGTIDARVGDRCEIVIVDSGDREAGRECRVDVRCPDVTQLFGASSCPIGDPKTPVRMQMNGLEIDGAARTATFTFWNGEVPQGGATLRLAPPR